MVRPIEWIRQITHTGMGSTLLRFFAGESGLQRYQANCGADKNLPREVQDVLEMQERMDIEMLGCVREWRSNGDDVITNDLGLPDDLIMRMTKGLAQYVGPTSVFQWQMMSTTRYGVVAVPVMGTGFVGGFRLLLSIWILIFRFKRT